MPNTLLRWVTAAIGICLSILFATQITDDISEITTPPTSCSFSGIGIYFDDKNFTVEHNKNGLDVELRISLSGLGSTQLSSNVNYSVIVQSIEDLAGSEPRTIANGAVVVNSSTVIPTAFSLSNAELQNAKNWEVKTFVNTDHADATSYYTETIYLSIDDAKSKPQKVSLIHPFEYWHFRMEDMNRRNITLPKSLESNDTASCSCTNEIVPSIHSISARPPPGGEGPLPGPTVHPVTQRITVNMRYQLLGTKTTDYMPPFPSAKVIFYTSDESMYLYEEFSLQLNSAGRASTIFSTTSDHLVLAAKLVWDDNVFTMKSGTDHNNLVTYSQWLNMPGKQGTKNNMDINDYVPASFGSGASILWVDLHRTRSLGDAMVGLSGVPRLDIWYPGHVCPNCWTHYDQDRKFIEYYPLHLGNIAVAAHEYGHHVMSSLMNGGFVYPDGLPSHQFCPPTVTNDQGTRQIAFVEGYATAFALQVLGIHVVDGWDLEAYSCPRDRDMTLAEARFAAGLLDLMDINPAVPECNGGNLDLGKTGWCDRTGGQLFTPQMVLRESIAGPQVQDISSWWDRLTTVHKGKPGISDGYAAMQYNYYPSPPCRHRIGQFCLDSIYKYWQYIPVIRTVGAK